LFEHVVRTQVPHPIYGRYALRDWHLVVDSLRKILTAPPLIKKLVAATKAESLVLWRTKLFEKFPGDGPVDWHQEYGYFDGEEIGGHSPSLFPIGPANPWNLTV